MAERVTAFVMARSGRMRDGLIALLRAIPAIDVVESLDHKATQLKSMPPDQRTVVLLEAGLMHQELWQLLKPANPGQAQRACKCIVLADNSLQHRLAEAAGADRVLLAGFPATEFFDTVENLFDQQKFLAMNQGGAKK